MKKIKLLLSALTVVFFTKEVKSQEIENLIKAADDANKIANAYASPAAESLIYGMNSGWFHTAKVHKKFGFDIAIGVSGVSIPSEKEIYKISELGLKSTIKGDFPKTSPTIFGEDVKGKITLKTQVSGTIEGKEVKEEVEIPLDLPTGFKKDLPASMIPTPSVQVTVGLPWELETSLRFIPKIGNDNVKGGLFGIGIKKELTQYLGAFDKLPFHLSIMGTYTNMGVDAPIKSQNNSDFTIKNAKTTFNLNGYTVQALASLNFPIINVYGAVGYGGGNADLKVLGDYTIVYDDANSGKKITKTLQDPINQQYSTGGIKATLGARLSLGFFKIFADYTLQEYNTASAGIAFSFR